MVDQILPKATHYHRLPMRGLNAVIRGLNLAGAGHIKLDEATLIAKAMKIPAVAPTMPTVLCAPQLSVLATMR